LVDQLNQNTKEAAIDEDYYDDNFLSLVEEIESESKLNGARETLNDAILGSSGYMLTQNLRPSKNSSLKKGQLLPEDYYRLTASVYSQGDIYEITKSNSQVFDY
jgi:hypothetical protein